MFLLFFSNCRQQYLALLNLENTLELAASQGGSVSTLKAGSNADLGLMRSLAVVIELLKI